MSSLDAAVSFAVAGVMAAVLTPVAARLASAMGVVSPPRPDRWGSRPTPLLGGAAIVVATVTVVLVLAPITPVVVVVCGGLIAAFLMGLVDDIRGMRPSSKLVGQIVIASGLAIGGVHAEFPELPPLGYAFTLLWVVGVMNAVNLMDNMDGLAAGVAAIAAAVLVLMAPIDPPATRVIAAALAGASIGFLVHNFHPAKVYMGDAGSQALGFGLAALALILTRSAASNIGLALLGPLLALGLPLYDTVLVSLTRRIEGRPLGQGGKDHTSHRLAALGLGERATVVSLYVIAAAFAVLGLLFTALDLALLPILGVVLIALVLFGVFLAEAPSASLRSIREVPRGRVVLTARSLIRFGGEVMLDVVLALVALMAAYLLRFEASPTSVWIALFVQAAPVVVPIQLAAFVAGGVYRTLWRYLGVTDLIVIVRSTFLGTAVAALLVLYPFNALGQSRAVMFIDWILLALLVTGSRTFLVWLRHWFALRPRAGERRVLVVGATEAGEMAIRLLLRSTEPAYRPIGLLDDDPGKQRRNIAGVPVIGTISDLGVVAAREGAHLVVIAVTDRDVVQGTQDVCDRLGLESREFARVV